MTTVLILCVVCGNWERTVRGIETRDTIASHGATYYCLERYPSKGWGRFTSAQAQEITARANAKIDEDNKRRTNKKPHVVINVPDLRAKHYMKRRQEKWQLGQDAIGTTHPSTD